MKVSELMTPEVFTCNDRAMLAEAVKLMWEHDIGFVPVLSAANGAPVGVITDRDACMAAWFQGKPLWDIPVRSAMSTRVFSCRDVSEVDEAELLMSEYQVHRLPVLDGEGKLCGIVTETDFAAKERGVPFSIHILPQVFSQLMPQEAIERIREAARTTAAREIMITEVITATEETPVCEVAAKMLRYDIEHIPVVRDGAPVGIVSRHDLLRMIVRQAEAK